jgi:hypothetical protein
MRSNLYALSPMKQNYHALLLFERSKSTLKTWSIHQNHYSEALTPMNLTWNNCTIWAKTPNRIRYLSLLIKNQNGVSSWTAIPSTLRVNARWAQLKTQSSSLRTSPTDTSYCSARLTRIRFTHRFLILYRLSSQWGSFLVALILSYFANDTVLFIYQWKSIKSLFRLLIYLKSEDLTAIHRALRLISYPLIQAFFMKDMATTIYLQ